MKQQTLRQAWDDYNKHGRSMGRKDNTMNGRQSAFGKFVDQHGHRKLSQISDQHIAEYMLRAAETRQASSLASTNAIISAFFTYCVKTGRLQPQQNPMLVREAPKVEKKEQIRVPVHRWPELLQLAQENGPRDRMLIAMGLYTLLRDQEMAMIRIRDVDLGAGSILAHIPKTNDMDRVPITADLDYELRTWYSHYQSKVGPLNPDMLLLPARRPGPPVRQHDGTWKASPYYTYDPYAPLGKSARIVTPLLVKLGYPARDERGRRTGLGAHTLRRSGARAYYDHHVNQNRVDAFRLVKTMLHHSRDETTQKYIGLREDRETRDQLLRGVTIFGLHELSSIGGVHLGHTEAVAQVL